MPEKLVSEEEKKILVISNYLEQLRNKQITHEELIELKKILVGKLETFILPLGLESRKKYNTKLLILEELNSELLDDLYSSHPLYQNMKNFIEYSEDLEMLSESIIKTVCESLLNIFDRLNDMGEIRKPHQLSILDEGEPTMTEEERHLLKSRINMIALYYKDGSVAQKKGLAYRASHLADTKEKYMIINDIFYEITGEKVLDKMKKIEVQNQPAAT